MNEDDEIWEDDPCDHDHDWQEVWDADGGHYLQCRNCDQLAGIPPKPSVEIIDGSRDPLDGSPRNRQKTKSSSGL